MVPQPVKAIVLLFPITDEYETARKEEDKQILEKGQHPIDPTILWIKQTVRPLAFRAIARTYSQRNRLEMRAARWV